MKKIKLKNKKTIIISAGGTGGHIFPALSVIKQLRNYKLIIITDIRGEPYFRNFFEVNKENKDYYKYKIYSYKVTSPSNDNLIKIIISVFQFFLATIKLIKLFISIKPNIIIGFGVYPTLAPVIAGKTLRIPVIIHEQNAILGRANRFLSKFSNILALSFETTKCSDIQVNSIYSGNPCREEFQKIGDLGYKLPELNSQFIILIIGGSLGASFFSKTITKVLCSLPIHLKKRLLVFHQVRNEDIIKVKDFYKTNNINSKVSSFFDNVFDKFKASHLIITRSGGSTVSEILASHRPAIFIPLPSALDNHQEENAKFISSFKGGWLLDQNKTTTQTFIDVIEDIMLNPEKLSLANQEIKKVSIHNFKLLRKMSPTQFLVNTIKNCITPHQEKKRLQH